ncbi:snurportin-1-like [Amphibalanus amphitrite]|uniref:snurportin-1-like n=1 Tax=Amphibalanus amphitrite TaxID=1232801 RepID=UPI001C9052DF|nr:snurportin-1-like [Amphibalanus amphitrite]XP_043232956.1 snurportin-1-like [Amphibalanus amphitrite]
MEQLASQLADSRLASGAEPDEPLHAPRLAQYKNAGRASVSQQCRRSQLLQRQKRERDGRLDRLRAITADDDEGALDAAALPPTFSYRKQGFYQSQYSNQLMFSEWMETVPADLHTDWLLKMCPPGKRCLVVAKRRCTRSYSAAGALLRTFPSRLPAGWRGPLGQRPTVLDCIWDQAAGTFHVLDLLAWNGHQVFECEAEFRFTWLQTKLSETPEVGVASRSNPYRFVAISHTACGPAELAATATAAADGALFFHRAAHYWPGVSPLVLWLKPFMLPETLGVPRTAAELGAPPDYAGRQRYIDRWQASRHRKPEGRTRQDQMES